MTPKPKFQFAFEEVEISDDEVEEVQEKDMIENKLEDFLQSFSIPEEDVAVTPSAVTERDRESTMQSYTSTSEQVDALIVGLQRSTRKPPKIVLVTTEPPEEKKKKISKTLVLITDPVQDVSTPIEPSFLAQNIESTFTESSPVMQEISTPLPESTPMDQDFESPIIEQEVLLSEGAQASGSSFEALKLYISKGKNKLPMSKFVDVALL